MNTEKNTQEFDWDRLESGKRRKPNPEILAKYGAKNYCLEPYALDLYEKMILGQEILSKELKEGETRKIISVRATNKSEVHVILGGLIDAVVDLKREKGYLNTINMDPDGFSSYLNTEEGQSYFLNQEVQAIVEQVEPYVKVSISRGMEEKIKSELFKEIAKPTTAYIGKILEKNGGGFIIFVAGIKGFLPGSLAATNIVRDFDSMIGKEIPVVVEDYLRESNTFVFSYKKYVNMILPSKISELETDKMYTGNVTGVAKYGVFVEFDEIFTGLLHTSKMTAEMKKKFNDREVTAGNELTFWIKEITADKKIILTDEDPTFKRLELEEFKEKNLGTIRGGEVISVQPFGTLVKLQKDICGMISQKEIKTKKKNFTVGDTVMVSIDRVHNDKIFLSLPNEG
jgi:ribosomal protein S1